MDIVLRIAVIYLFVVAALRVLGKREFGQLSPLELVSLLMIPEIVAPALTGDNYSVTNAIVGVATLLVLVFATSLLTHRFKKAEIAVDGEPTVLVHRGEVFERHMNLTRITPDEVFAEMHKSGLQRLDQVEWAILETDGSIAIVPVSDANARSVASKRTQKDKVVT